MEPELLIPKHGGYRKLKRLPTAQPCYDATAQVHDCLIEKLSRTHDQMAQAALSGVRNIAEGNEASGTSRKLDREIEAQAAAFTKEGGYTERPHRIRTKRRHHGPQ